MLKKVAVKELTVGVFVHRFDDSWLNHPLWRTRFLIGNTATLNKVRESGVRHCWIDVSQGRDIPSPPMPTKPAAPDLARLAQPSKPQRRVVSLSDELPQAAQLRARAAKAMSRILSDARLGNAMDTSVCAPLVDDGPDNRSRYSREWARFAICMTR